MESLSLTSLNQNFAAVRTAYADKLKKLKEVSRSGAIPPPATPTAGQFVPSRIKKYFSSNFSRSQDAGS
jgi:hypothetical protein